MPIFGTLEQQVKDVTKGSRGEGNDFAAIFIPEHGLQVEKA